MIASQAVRNIRVMASKSQRRRAAKRKRAQRGARPVEAEDTPTLPRPLRLAMEGYERMATLVDQSANEAEAREILDEQLRAAVERVMELTERFDAFDVIECLKISETRSDPETYSETEHEGLAAVIELAAAILSCRGTRYPGAEHLATSRLPHEVIDEVRTACREVADVGSMALLLDAVTASDDQAKLAMSAALREIFVRNLTYEHMLIDTLAGLFDEPAVELASRQAIGCTGAEVRSVVSALQEMHAEAWHARFASVAEFMNFLTEAHASWLAAAEAADAAGDPPPAVDDAERERARELYDATWSRPADASVVDVLAVASRTGLPAEVVSIAVELLSQPMTGGEPLTATKVFLSGRTPFRTRPLLSDPDGSIMAVHESLVLAAVRDRMEEELKNSAGWNVYTKHRGEFLEAVSLGHLQTLLPGANVRSSLKYFVPDPTRIEPTPATYTKLVEGDGLVLLDDVAIILEAKAGAFGTEARAGSRTRLRSDLRKLLTEAAKQSARLRERLDLDGGVRLQDGSWLDLSGVREVHQIVVTLEDLSSIATETVELVRAGLLSIDDLPWTVSVHDLRIIAELVERPAEFLLYLRRRTEPMVTLLHHAVDELDLFLEFFANGLYVEPDPKEVHSRMPHLGEPSVAARRRFEGQGVAILTSRTDALDAWYFHNLGIREAQAPKPSHNANPKVQELVDSLEQMRQDGWLATGATLLAASSALQDRFAKMAPDLQRLTRRDDESHSYTTFSAGDGNDTVLLIWVTLAKTESVASATRRLRPYMLAKKHQMQAATAACMIFGPDPLPLALLYENKPTGSDPDLDAVIAESNLRPPTAGVDPRPGRGASRRRGG